jgi:hypothetical protein
MGPWPILNPRWRLAVFPVTLIVALFVLPVAALWLGADSRVPGARQW